MSGKVRMKVQKPLWMKYAVWVLPLPLAEGAGVLLEDEILWAQPQKFSITWRFYMHFLANGTARHAVRRCIE
jgi:hypothetical protein